jgi:hypothetical protein
VDVHRGMIDWLRIALTGQPRNDQVCAFCYYCTPKYCGTMVSARCSDFLHDHSWLKGFWKWIFYIEIPICLSTVLFWVARPYNYLSSIDERTNHTVTPMEWNLLLYSAQLVFCAYVVFYGIFLYRITIHPSKNAAVLAEQKFLFTALQIAMGVGDLVMIFASLDLLRTMNPVNKNLIAAQVVIAGFYAIVRLIFIIGQARDSLFSDVVDSMDNSNDAAAPTKITVSSAWN